MAQIIYLWQQEVRNCKDETVFEASLSARLNECISDVKSSGDEVFLWVRELESNLNDLDVVANALAGPSQGQLREQIQLLRCRLSSALIELNRTLQNLPSNVPSLRLCSLEQLATLVAHLSRVEVTVPPDGSLRKNAKIKVPTEQSLDLPTASRN